MIIELCGGEPSNVVQAGEIPNHGRAYKVDTARIESLVGMAIPPHKQLNILENLGFVIKAILPVYLVGGQIFRVKLILLRR